MSLETSEIENILESIKDYCGVQEEETAFDNELLMYTNNAFAVLAHIGVGPSVPLVVNNSTVWSDLALDEKTSLAMVKTYIYLRVRRLFDAPQNSSLNTAMKETMDEFEWRLNAMADIPETDSGA